MESMKSRVETLIIDQSCRQVNASVWDSVWIRLPIWDQMERFARIGFNPPKEWLSNE